MAARMDMPPHARAGWDGRGHRFAAYPRCSTDSRGWHGQADVLAERNGVASSGYGCCAAMHHGAVFAWSRSSQTRQGTSVHPLSPLSILGAMPVVWAEPFRRVQAKLDVNPLGCSSAIFSAAGVSSCGTVGVGV
jgi:hypothetical protein